MTNQHRLLAAMLLAIGLFLTAQTANASTISVGIGAFGAGSTLTTFDGQTLNGEVNGTTVNGILYQYSLGNGNLVFDGGPGVTNNISPLNIVSIGNPTGFLTLTFPSPVDTFGYGFAILANATIPATFISLFDGATNVGSQLYVGAPDPDFTGGFAGIQSTLPFNRVQLTFNPIAPAFAVDNVRTFNAAAVPEPATLTLLGSGIVAAAWRRRRWRNGRP